MSIPKATFDSLPDIDDPQSFAAWEETVLSLVDQFSLTQTQYELIEGRYNTVAGIFEAPHDPRLNGVHFHPQGSFLTRTVIKPPSAGEIDVDGIAWSPDGDLKAIDLYDAVHEELNSRVRTDREVARKNRCSRIEYADESPSFHMDVTPAINAFGNVEGKNGDGKLMVPDLKEIEFGRTGYKPSAPKLYATWVNDSAEKYSIVLKRAYAAESHTRDAVTGSSEPLPDKEVLDHFDPLRACIKLLKFHREKFFAGHTDADFRPISVLLTTLACKAYRKIATASMSTPLSPMNAIIAIVDALPAQFDNGPSGGEWKLSNPVLTTENFAERWNEQKDGHRRKRAFSEWHAQIKMDVRLGLKGFPSPEDFTRTVVEAIGVRGASSKVENILNRELASGGPVFGLSMEAIDNAVSASAASRVFGIGRERPRQDPEPPRRLA
ncbi:MAG: nucleotidyltransferase [Gammaproteobacteria bacterium]|nr:nucleotidyltransferase [Gammaproteobacteria bacterium]